MGGDPFYQSGVAFLILFHISSTYNTPSHHRHPTNHLKQPTTPCINSRSITCHIDVRKRCKVNSPRQTLEPRGIPRIYPVYSKVNEQGRHKLKYTINDKRLPGNGDVGLSSPSSLLDSRKSVSTGNHAQRSPVSFDTTPRRPRGLQRGS